MAIRRGLGSLLDAEADALVNAVNTVGVMGRGIALQFKKAFPDNFRAYRAACRRGEVQPGRMFVFETGRLKPRLIVNFPTKRHWRLPSRLEDVRDGLTDLAEIVRTYDIRSIAVPALGAGNGGLDWSKVRPLILRALGGCGDLDVLLYEPGGAPEAAAMPIEAVAIRMTLVRAVVTALFDGYLQRAFTLGRLEAQKLAYLLHASGEPLPRIDFAKGRFGPYSETLNHLLAAIDGHFISGFGDRDGRSDIIVLADARAEAARVLREHPDSAARVDRVLALIEGYEGLYGMELLATVHWVVAHDLMSAASPDAAVAQVQGWNRRKHERFSRPHIEDAWKHLEGCDWLRPTRAFSADRHALV